MMWDGSWTWMFFGPLITILFVAAVIVLVVVALRWIGGSHGALGSKEAPPPPSAKTPLDILKERFARGEIDRAEFEERRRVLNE
jgi:putative membrane protein